MLQARGIGIVSLWPLHLRGALQSAESPIYPTGFFTYYLDRNYSSLGSETPVHYLQILTLAYETFMALVMRFLTSVSLMLTVGFGQP
jgi:hypothetical protein